MELRYKFFFYYLVYSKILMFSNSHVSLLCVCVFSVSITVPTSIIIIIMIYAACKRRPRRRENETDLDTEDREMSEMTSFTLSPPSLSPAPLVSTQSSLAILEISDHEPISHRTRSCRKALNFWTSIFQDGFVFWTGNKRNKNADETV